MVDQSVISRPLSVTGTSGRFDITVKVSGGGVTGQAGAVCLAVARALLKADPEYRKVLRDHGFLTRDARAKERKKAGLKRARKAPQYTKR
jgi:small subunit ribosomal protein S9